MADGYLGNSNLKRIGEEIEWSPDLLQEYMKCAKDPIYFAKNYIKIVHVDKGLVPFKMYDYQESITRKITDNRRLAVLTARQSGKTTTAMAIILHYVLFNEFKTVAILANKGDAAREVMARVKLAFEALPKWLQQGVEEWNKGNIALENGCQVLAGTTSSSAIRGKSVNFLYLDEVAFIEGYDDFFASVYPTISSGESTKLLMTSTPNGLNHFWKTCTGAKEGTNGYEYEEVMWHDVPGRDEKWRKETIEALDHDEEKFNQEYCCQFLGSSGTLIAGWKLKELLHQKPIAQHDGFIQYEKPIKERQYSMTVDVARGKGLDYSCFSVIDITEMPYKQVAMFRDNMVGPIDFASVVYRIGQMYNTAGVLIEVNDIGEQVADVLLMDYGYDNILYTANNGRSGKMLTGGFGKKVDNGIRTTKNVKATGCSMLKMLVEQNQLIIQDYDTIQEISRFSKKANSFEAESGFHDDLVMNLVLFAWMTEQAYFKDMTDINTLIKLREKTEEQIEEELLPFGLIDSGEDFYYEDDGLRL
jgi:phage FluMu gp28-like protein